ncbi:MAG TPA: LysR substrate-binding domain-containing protein [Rhodanobacteraceae bacterium]|nr:LysR substrate-binding domain-containing protein [Rhodanobacteraceae bacterium]
MLRRLSLRQLTVFLEAVRHMNFARAAETLHLTQPAISMQIRQLEGVVGLPLFERVGKRLALTPAGELFRHHAARVLGELQDAEQALQSMKGLRSGQANVGLVSTAKYFAPKLLAQFARHHPQVDIQFLVGNRETLINALRDNEIDFAVMGRPPEKLDASAEPVAENPHMFVAHKGHRLLRAVRFDLHELRDEAFLMREPGSGTRLVMEAVFKQHLFTPQRIMTLGSNESVKQTVMAGMGVSLLSLHTLELELRTGEIGLLDINGTPVMRSWHLVNMNAKMLSPAAAAFRQFLLEHTHTHLDKTFAPYRKIRRARKVVSRARG